MTFTEICRHVFRQAITDYHQTDNVDSAMHNPYPEGDIKYELYTKEWIDTVQWHLEDIIRNMVRVLVLRPKKRPYKTNNFYAVIERQNQLDKEVYRIVHPKKAVPHSAKRDKGRNRKGKSDR